MNEEIKKLANSLYKPVGKLIIQNRIKDTDYIEYYLDRVMDIYTEKGFYLFIELVLYYSTVNLNNAREYLNILKELREEEYNDFIKKYQKSL